MIGFYIGPLSPFNRHNCLYLLYPRTNEHPKLKHFHTLKRIQVKCLSLNDNGKRMKKIAYIIIGLTAVIAACGKKSTPKPTPPVLSLSGKYVLYLNSDTLYKGSSAAAGIAEIINQNAGGDTAYMNPATPQLVVKPNVIVGYNPVTAMLDTVNFTSDTEGKERTSLGTFDFTYSLQTGVFYDLSDHSIAEKIIRLNDNTVKLIITQKANGAVIGNRGNYYLKVN